MFYILGDVKRRRITSDNVTEKDDVIFIADEVIDTWDVVDDEVMVKKLPADVIVLSDDSDCEVDVDKKPVFPSQLKKNMTADERQTIIKQEILDDDDDLLDDDIILIDDEYDDAQDNLNLSAAIELADTSVIDEFFGEDILLKDFRVENDVMPSGSRSLPNPGNDIITCPICQEKLQRKLFDEHLDGCTGITLKVKPSIKGLHNIRMPEAKPSKRPTRKKSAKQLLKDAGYSPSDLQNITLDSDDDADESSLNSTFSDTADSDNRPRTVRQRAIYQTTRQCPICAVHIEESQMNDHLDQCILDNRKQKSSS